MDATRLLIVSADGYGAGPETSRGIRELAEGGAITCAALLVNSPFVAQAVHAWARCPVPADLAWQPCLTLDRPVAPVPRVPSLVGPDGCFWPLPLFLSRATVGLISPREVEVELRAQLARFVELLGFVPGAVCPHQHIDLAAPVGRVLRRVLADCRPLPYVRRVRESGGQLARVPGARFKRIILTALGKMQASDLGQTGFPGNDSVLAVNDPATLRDPEALAGQLACVAGRVAELVCKPGHPDPTLSGRVRGETGQRAEVLEALRRLAFQEACRRAGFVLASPAAVRAKLRAGWATPTKVAALVP